jgi:hypothetical protein
VVEAAPVALMLALQRGAGNQAASRLARRKQKAPKTLEPPFAVGSFTSHDFEVTLDAVAVREMKPGPAAGEGFETEAEAVVAAGSGGRIGVVIADADERLRAFETDLSPFPSQPYVVPYPLPAGRFVRWVRMKAVADAMSWAAQMEFAEELHESGEADRMLAARQIYTNILVNWVGLAPTEVHDSSAGPALPGKVNFNIGLKDVRGHAGEPGKLPSDRDTQLVRPTLEVGPFAFEDVISLRGTIQHEFSHVHHAEKAIAAVERWRATEPKLEFLVWLDDQKEKGKLSALDTTIIKGQVKGETGATEALSYLRGFMTTYHVRELDEVGDAADTKLFGSLGYLMQEWNQAGHAVHDEVIASLVTYREQDMDDAHRARFDAYVAPRRTWTFYRSLPLP